MYAEMDGTRLFFDVDGPQWVPDGGQMRQRPVLLLLHGGPGGDHGSFKKIVGQLRDVAQLVYLDHRGSGRSDPVEIADCTLDNNIDDVERLRRHLGLESISVLGYKQVFEFWEIGRASALAVVVWVLFFIFCNVFYQIAQKKLKAF